MVVKWIKYLDMFALPIDLNIQGDRKYRTLEGVWFTLAYLFIITAIAVNEFLGYIEYEPLTISKYSISHDYPQIDMIKSRQLPGLLLYGQNGQMIQLDKIGQYITAVVQETAWVSGQDSGLAFQKKVSNSYRMVPCQSLSQSDFDDYFSYINKTNYLFISLRQNGLCTQLGSELFVKGSFQDSRHTTLSIAIKPCSLSNDCSKDSLLESSYIHLISPKTRVNSTNSKSPVNQFLDANNIYTLDPSRTQRTAINLQRHKLEDYIGILPKWVETDTFYDAIRVEGLEGSRTNSKLSCTLQEIEDLSPSCQSYYEQTYRSSNSFSVTQRKYKTMAETLGSIGGTNGVIIIVLTFLYSPINRRKRNTYLLEKVYSLLVSEQSQINKIKSNRKSLLKRCICKKKINTSGKKQIGDKGMDKRKIALERIQDSLDVVNIVRDFNFLKVLVHFIFENRHFGLAQLVGFDLWFKEREVEAQKQRDVANMASEDQKITIFNKEKRFREEEMKVEYSSYKLWIEDLNNQVNEGWMSNEDPKDTQTKLIDEFYHENLQDISGKMLNIDSSKWEFLLNFIQKIDDPNIDGEAAKRSNFSEMRKARHSIDMTIARQSRDILRGNNGIPKNNLGAAFGELLGMNNRGRQIETVKGIIKVKERKDPETNYGLSPVVENMQIVNRGLSTTQKEDELSDTSENAGRPKLKYLPYDQIIPNDASLNK